MSNRDPIKEIKRRYLSMPDPCPHVTRLQVIKANIHGEELPYCECVAVDDEKERA
jgi:hypothetical protein